MGDLSLEHCEKVLSEMYRELNEEGPWGIELTLNIGTHPDLRRPLGIRLHATADVDPRRAIRAAIATLMVAAEREWEETP